MLRQRNRNQKTRKNSDGIHNFTIGYTNSAFFESGEEGSTEGGVLKKALVAVEGSFKDSNGREHEFSQDRLKSIANYTNQALESGTIIPVCTDHKKEVGNTVGAVEGQAYTKVISQEDLPNPKATHLVGKLGLFFNDVAVKAQEVAEKVKNGIVTSVSMGLNLDPKDHRIVELSLVPIPAIPNMGLFSMLMGDTDNAFTWEDLEASEEQLDDLKEEYDDLSEKLWTLLNNIYTSEGIDISDLESLKLYVANVLNGFSLRVMDMLGLSMAETPDPTQSMTQTADQATQMQQQQLQGVALPSQQTQAVYKKAEKGVAKFSRKPRYTRK